MKSYANFSLYPYTDILFGKGTENEVGKMVRKHGGTKVLIVYGGGSVKKSGLFDKVTKAFKDEGISFIEFGGVQPNPRRSLAEKGIKLAQNEKIDFLLGLGGGSAIDTAKAIGLALANNGEYWKFYNGTPAEKMFPVGTIHTLSAAGSETSRSTVLVDDLEKGLKKGLGWDCCRPVFAIMNPELTYSVSPYQTGVGAADIFAHTFGRYFMRNTPHCFLGDQFCEGLMKTVVQYAVIAIANPNDYEARAELMLAASFSHSDHTGLGGRMLRAGEHPIEHQFSGHYDTPHGAGLAVIMPALLRYIVDTGNAEEVARAAQFGVGVFGVQPDMTDVKATAYAGVKAFQNWLRSIGMPLTLPELGIPASDSPAIVKRLVDVNNGKIAGFVDLDEKALTAVFSFMTKSAA